MDFNKYNSNDHLKESTQPGSPLSFFIDPDHPKQLLTVSSMDFESTLSFSSTMALHQFNGGSVAADGQAVVKLLSS